jgi:ferredoxin-NADP reductase
MTTYPLRVRQKRQETPDCVSLWLEIPTDLKQTFEHRAGQFITVEADIGDEHLARQYSLSSLPGDEGGLRITVKKLPGGRVSTWLTENVKEGDLIEVAPPRGRFFQPPDGAHRVLLLAAGSGIAPILPIARHLLDEGNGHRVTLGYGSRHADEIILGAEVDELPGRHGSCKVEHVLSRPAAGWEGLSGRIDAALIRARMSDWTGQGSYLPLTVYLCGPESFMDAAEAHLLAEGLDPSAIRRESFDLVLDDADDEPPIEVAGSDAPGEDAAICESITAIVGGEEVSVTPEPGETILGALLRIEADVPFSCQEGTCSSCISKLKQGKASVAAGVRKTLRPDDLGEGLVLACLAKPKTKSIVIDFDDI